MANNIKKHLVDVTSNELGNCGVIMTDALAKHLINVLLDELSELTLSEISIMIYKHTKKKITWK